MAKLVVLLVSLLMVACTMSDKVGSLSEGMSRAEVESVLGRPDGFQRSGTQVGYQYTNRFVPWTGQRADYYTVFENDQLTQWGTGEIRPGPDVNYLVVVPAG